MLAALEDLGVTLPVLAAPMAGGPTTPELVVAASAAGGLGFIAAGYKSTEALAGQVQAVRSHTEIFGVNLFAPNPVPVDTRAYARYREQVRPDAERLGATVPEEPLEDDDEWRDKIDLLLADPVPVVSFTFGLPDPPSLDALRAAGSLLVQTVTSTAEAERAAGAGVDAHDANAPPGYPALHHLTSPMRRAAAAAGDAEHVNLWAGTGYRSCVARPASEILERLAGGA